MGVLSTLQLLPFHSCGKASVEQYFTATVAVTFTHFLDKIIFQQLKEARMFNCLAGKEGPGFFLPSQCVPVLFPSPQLLV